MLFKVPRLEEQKYETIVHYSVKEVIACCIESKF
jgi:hypothetical protein